MAATHTHALLQIPRIVPSVSRSTSQTALNSEIQQYCMTTCEPYVHPTQAKSSKNTTATPTVRRNMIWVTKTYNY